MEYLVTNSLFSIRLKGDSKLFCEEGVITFTATANSFKEFLK
jgi:hypothetical protein